jgi:hypothetical protein
MANRYQEQVFQRKLLYIGLILVLFTGSWGWRRYVIDAQANQMAVREGSRGEADLTSSVVRVGLTGMQGLVTCVLWNSAIDAQKKNQWSELKVLVDSLTKLQPYFITPWLFQSWNLAYNVSVESDRVRDKYFYITEGIELLTRGERQNRNHPDLRWSVGFYTQHKICQSDETNVQRSLFDLSKIPPNERDPARFWTQGAEGPAFNYAEFEAFCRKYPHLVRRLREGIHTTTLLEKKRQFTCEKPEDVAQFLEDNQQVPGLYAFKAPDPTIPSSSRRWDRNAKDVPLRPTERFPALPPPHRPAFDNEALDWDSPLGTEVNGFAAAHAWYCYAQEPLPAPDVLPGNSKEITDRTRHRKPRNMTTLIFRNYPAQGRRYMAERLQQEGWFDDEDYDLSEWFQDSAAGGKSVKVGGGRKWSLEAWQKAANAWQKHGEDNHLLFRSQAEEQRMRERAERFWKRYELAEYSLPPELREQGLTPEERDEHYAARYLFEWHFYNQVSNYKHHYYRALVEAKEATVRARKLFYRAEALNLAGSPQPALQAYQQRRDWGKGRKLSALEAWRDLVLLPDKDFRRDSFIQEQTAEIQLRYQGLYDRYDGKAVKERLGMAVAVVPPSLPAARLLSASLPNWPTVFPRPVSPGPLDVTDGDGKPLIERDVMERVLDRMNLLPRKKPTGAEPARPSPPSR